MCTDTKYEWEKWQQPVFFIIIVIKSRGWCHVRCSSLIKLFVKGKFTECFHFPIVWHLCLMHVSVGFHSSTVTLPTPLVFRNTCSMSLISGDAPYLYLGVPNVYILYISFFFLMCEATIICLSLHTNKALWVCSEAEHEMLILSCCQCEAVRVYFELWHLTSVHNNTDQEQPKNNSTTSVGLVVTVEIAWVEWVTLTVAFSWIHLAL